MKYKLSEIGRIVTGKTPSTKNKTSFSEQPDKYLFVTPRDMNGSEKTIKKTERYLTDEVTNTFKNLVINDKSICVSCIGTIGKVFMPSGPAITNQQINSITEIKIFVLPDYLYYYLTIHQKDIENLAGGTTMPIVNKTSFEQLEVEIPDLETQKRIVRILSALDQKIELNNRLIDLLYSLGDAFYEKIQNDNPRTVTLKDISINHDKRRVPLSSRQREKRRGKFPYYGATSILDYVDDYLFDGEYVLLGEDGTVMTNEGGAVLQYIWGKNWVNNHAHVLQGSEVSTEYLLFALRSVNVSALVTGAVQPKINQENMNKIKLSIGSEDKMSEVEESIKTIAAQIRNLTNENKSLSDMRDTLLPKLMSSEIDLDKVML